MSLTKTLKRFDVYRKLEDEEYARVQTTSGGLLSLGCLLFSITLFINEFVTWRKPEVKHELSVDQSLFDTFDINFDIIIPHIQCRYLQLKVFDKSGMQQQVLSNTLHFHDLDENGTTLRARPLFANESLTEHFSRPENNEYIVPSNRRRNSGSDVPPECIQCGMVQDTDECCTNCDEVLNAYYRKGLSQKTALHTSPQCFGTNSEAFFVSKTRGGCNVHGILTVGRCEGRLQIMPFDEFTMPATNTQDATLFLQKEYNLTHVIRRFSFGKEVGESKEMKKVGGADWKATFAQSLENVTTTQGTSVGSFNYFLKIVPTTLQTTRKKSQFVVQELKQVRQAQMKDATHDAHNTTLEKDGDDPLTTRGTSTEEQAASLSLYQYSTTHYFSPFQFGATTPPGIHMFYDLSPISITISESPPSLSSFFHFITSLCAIIGGVLTVAGIIDGLIWRVDKRYKAKVRIGKAQ